VGYSPSNNITPPFAAHFSIKACDFYKKISCSNNGVFHYQPEKNGMILYYHEGYLPGSSSIAVIDSYGGVTVVLRSGFDKLLAMPANEWIVWIYHRLNLHYTMQGQLAILNALRAN
jgi:D-alanyl-D-alanine carboxypeptidase